MNISWDYCSRGDFQILSSLLIKNISFEENKNNIQNCIFFDKLSKRLFATNCNILLTIKSKNLDKFLDIDQFEFFWLNQSQIKTKDEKCLNPVETTIIKNNIISYHGFIDVRDCLLNISNRKEENEKKNENENTQQLWQITENNRIVNKYNKKCLVISKEYKNILNLFLKKEGGFLSKEENFDLIGKNEKSNFMNNNNYSIKNESFELKNLDIKLKNELKEFNLYDVYLGDCIGNLKGYEGRENFILEEFKTEKLEIMALKKLVNVYKKANNNIENLISKSSEEMIKLIKFNSQLIDDRQLIDNVENKLEEAQSNLDRLAENDDIESYYEKDGNIKKSNLNFQIYGLIFEKIEIIGI